MKKTLNKQPDNEIVKKYWEQNMETFERGGRGDSPKSVNSQGMLMN